MRLSEQGKANGKLLAAGAVRAGYVTKGVIHALIGGLALLIAFGGAGGESADGEGAVQTIAQQPFGGFLLVLTGLGLCAYSLWRFADACGDLEQRGSNLLGLAKRAGVLVSGLVYLSLAIYATSRVLGFGTGSGSRQEWTARLMNQPFGHWAVGFGGLVMIGVGALHTWHAVDARFLEKQVHDGRDIAQRGPAKWIGRIGLCTRGVAIALIGTFLVIAAVEHDPQEARGLGRALSSLSSKPYGSWLIALIALGFISYGLHCLIEARCRRLPLG